ncbi:putative major pilin subunit [Anaerohalosphaera lusitana]|uniref:Putative major pilin subunit n=1 Tax=Anaerohalosphaera lusitana TaxID=1936003 RepID=A0A1U9NK20_9BACT|nr:prepilin-type N-terminal cleavage/methylation domain-containing protein [Anaerohalosphaera lusitana]AQT68157.1 putative major pilin subunit [Anaerohalosphaera lusitana]
MEKRRVRGFTLIELLVVIAIIALLLAIMMPALGMVKEKARGVVCRTNLKTMGLAGKLYAEEEGGRLPELNFVEGLWIDKLTVYMAEVDEARYCPMAKKNIGEERGLYQFGSAFESWMWNYDDDEIQEYGSYCPNGWFTDWAANSSPPYNTPAENYFKHINTVRQASNVPIFADARWCDGWVYEDAYVPEDYDLETGESDAGYATTAGGAMVRYISNRHGKRTNVVFADGHAEAVDLSEMWSLKWHMNWKPKHDVKRGPDHDGTPIYRD